jgi:hypothetical protein
LVLIEELLAVANVKERDEMKRRVEEGVTLLFDSDRSRDPTYGLRFDRKGEI